MFEQFGLHPRLLENVSRLKWLQPTDVQRAAIPGVLAGRDALISANTGSGKTACYLLPILHNFLSQKGARRGTRCLVMLPTRELAQQVHDVAKQLVSATRLNVGLITGGAEFKYQAAMLRRNPEILFATPGRLLDHIQRQTTEFSDLEALVLDEADRMLDLGLRVDIQAILATLGGHSEQRQTLLLSATLGHPGIREMADLILCDPLEVNASVERLPTEITQRMTLADDDDHKRALLLRLLPEAPEAKTLVFVNRREKAQLLRGWLRGRKIAADVLHGEIQQDKRRQTLHEFRRGLFRVLVATDVAARGLDIKDVALVVNFDMAHSADDYIHRVGRTARAGAAGVAISLISPPEWNLCVRIERMLGTSFERRKVPGLEGKYKGPKKLKASGKSATKGKRKKPLKGGSSKSNPWQVAAKKRGSEIPASRDGHSPLRRRK